MCSENVSRAPFFSAVSHGSSLLRQAGRISHVALSSACYCCLGFNLISLSISVPHSTCLPSLYPSLSDCTHFLVSPPSLISLTPPSSTIMWALIATAIISSAAPPGQRGPNLLPLSLLSNQGKGYWGFYPESLTVYSPVSIYKCFFFVFFYILHFKKLQTATQNIERNKNGVNVAFYNGYM